MAFFHFIAFTCTHEWKQNLFKKKNTKAVTMRGILINPAEQTIIILYQYKIQFWSKKLAAKKLLQDLIFLPLVQNEHNLKKNKWNKNDAQ